MQHRVFVLSTGRTGTKFVAKYFNRNFPEVWGVHEPPPAIFRLFSNAYAAGAIPLSTLRSLVRVTRRQMLAGKMTERPIYLESNNFIYGFFEVIAALEPPPTIVHIVRDPRTYSRSIIGNGNLEGVKLLASKIVPFWYAGVKRRFGRPSTPVGHFAAHWHIVNRFLQEHGHEYSHYHLLRFEDIFDEEKSGLQELCGIMGLEYPGPETALPEDKKVNRRQHKDIGPWQNWPVAWAVELHELATPLMQEHGYGFEPEWLDKVGLQGAPHAAQWAPQLSRGR